MLPMDDYTTEMPSISILGREKAKIEQSSRGARLSTAILFPPYPGPTQAPRVRASTNVCRSQNNKGIMALTGVSAMKVV